MNGTAAQADERYEQVLRRLWDLLPEVRNLLRDLDEAVGQRLVAVAGRDGLRKKACPHVR